MKQEKDKVRIIPIGGLGAIGRNMFVFEYGDDSIIVDCGIMFPREDMPGVDFIIPDFSYVSKIRDTLKGIIITHGHEDHIGAVPFLLQEVNAPIYSTRLSSGLIQSRLEERPSRFKPTFVEISPRDMVHIGAFVIEFLGTNHSIIDGVGLAIQTPVGTIIHSGDFKIDLTPVDGVVTDIYRFAEYGEKGVLLLMSDSTNAEVKGFTKSEDILNKKLIEIFSMAKGRIFVATFASNINRIQQVFDSARRYNRNVIISGLTMQKNIEIAHSLGYLSFRDELIVDIKEAKKLPLKKQVIMCTGTQGEPMSALSRIAGGTHKHFVAGSGDIVIITASVIPGNEMMVSNVVNSLMKVGAEVFYESEEDIHVSGHASQEELKLMISLTKPKFFLPIHGEYKHLRAHARIAEFMSIKPSRIVVAVNGDVLELSKSSFEKVDTLNLDEILVDGGEVFSMGGGLVKERRIMSREGIVFIVISLSKGRLLGSPEIFSRGFVLSSRSDILNTLKTEIEDHIEKLLIDDVPLKQISSTLKRIIRNRIYKLTRRSPIIDIQLMEF
jgi:ribonuclease J